MPDERERPSERIEVYVTPTEKRAIGRVATRQCQSSSGLMRRLGVEAARAAGLLPEEEG